MPETTLTIVPFAPGHLAGALALSQAEHWPHRAEDWALFLSLGRGVVALLDGRVAGTALVTRFGPVGLAGMIIVGEALRGRGLGRKLVEAAMATADVPEYRLIATEAGLPLYRKMGFVETGAVIQYQGILSAVPAPAPGDGHIGRAGAADTAALAALDRQATGLDRGALIAACLRSGQIVTLHDGAQPAACGQITGFAAIRPFGRGLLVGPVIARAAGDARALLAGAMADHAGAFVRIDIDAESGLGPWLEQAGLTRAGGGIVMSTAPRPRTTPIRCFAIAAQALG